MSSRIDWQTWACLEETTMVTGVRVYMEDCRGAVCMDEDPDKEPAWMYATLLPWLVFPRMVMPKPSTRDHQSPYESLFST